MWKAFPIFNQYENMWCQNTLYIGGNSSKIIHINQWVDHNCWKNNDSFCLLLQSFDIILHVHAFIFFASLWLDDRWMNYSMDVWYWWTYEWYPFLNCICLYDTCVLWYILFNNYFQVDEYHPKEKTTFHA